MAASMILSSPTKSLRGWTVLSGKFIMQLQMLAHTAAAAAITFNKESDAGTYVLCKGKYLKAAIIKLVHVSHTDLHVHTVTM